MDSGAALDLGDEGKATKGLCAEPVGENVAELRVRAGPGGNGRPDEVSEVRGDQAGFFPQLPRRTVQHCRVVVVDGATGDFPHVGHGVVAGALDEEDAALRVENEAAGCEAVEVGAVVVAEPLLAGDVPRG